MKPIPALALKTLTVAFIYALLGQLSVYPAVLGSINMEAIWLPSGFLFAVLMQSRRREWGLLLGAVVLAGFTVNAYQMHRALPSLLFAFTDPLEVLAGAWVANLILKGRPLLLNRTFDALILGLAGVINGAFAGIMGMVAAHYGGLALPDEFIGLVWANSVLLSHLFIAPILLAWPPRRRGRKRRMMEAVVWMVLAAAVTRLALHHGGHEGPQGLLLFLPFPLLALAAYRTGPWGTSLALSLVSFAALVESSHGHGPLPLGSLAPGLVMIWMQMFLATQTISLLVLACAFAEHQRTRGSLLESESRYRNLVEQFPDGIILREGSRIRYANPAALTLFGARSPGDLEGRTIRDFIHHREPSSGEFLQSDIRKHKSSQKERLLSSLSGQKIPVDVTDIRISLAEGIPVILDIFRDLTKRKAAEEALRRSEEDFRRFFDMAPMPLVLASEEGRLIRANPLALELFEVGDKPLDTFRAQDFYVRPGDRARLREMLATHGRVEGIEFDIITLSGRMRRVLASSTTVSFEGQSDLLLTGFMDMTLHSKAENALRQAQKLESLGLMAGGVAHDFNNLLTALIGNLDLARLSLEDVDTVSAEPYFEAMSATLRRASDLSRQMLAYAGQARVEIRPVDINQSVQELTGLMAASMSKKIRVEFDLEDGLPLIEGDPVQLQQVLLNLVTNAADAIGDQEGTITLRTRVAPSPDPAPAGSPETKVVVVEIMDTGSGMSEEVRARIFDPFFTTKAPGRGLGLSTLQGILKAHQASVHVESTPGKGSHFTLVFPLPASPSSPRVGSTTGPFALENLQGLVLLVDDESDIRLTAGSQLRRMGLDVIEACDGRDAVREVQRHGDALRLVVMDLSMPRMDGAEALALIRQTHPHLPVILSSGFDPTERASDLLTQPFTWFLPKPYRLAELRRVVAEVLARD